MKLRIVLAMGSALLCAAGGVALYYGLEVRAARRETAALVSAAWQRYGKRVALAELSPAREALLLAVEDPTFYRHHGVDLETPGAGMTTITQALVKLLYFPEGFKPGIKKIRRAAAGGLLDVEYNGKRSGGAAEEALMSALRLATDAAPSRSQRARSSSPAVEHK